MCKRTLITRMSKPTARRRLIVLIALLLIFMARDAICAERPKPVIVAKEVEVRLEAQADARGCEVVSFGLPLPPGFLTDPRRVRVLDARSQEIEAAVRPLEAWRIDGRKGAIRSLLVQFEADFSEQASLQVKVLFGKERQKESGRFVPVEQTLVDANGLKGPRVFAILPARWLCDSWVVGPQTPAAESGPYGLYDQFVERSFPGSLKYLDSQVYHEWLYDRTTCYYKMYVRSGDRKYLEAAYHAAHFVRLHTEIEGPDAGVFTLKGVDLKYIYPQAMHIHYLLTGDERALITGKVMAHFCLNNLDPVYRPASIKPTPLGVDPERSRKFWSPRQQAYGLLGILHGWEMTGEGAYWTRGRECVAAYHEHQRQPPDGHPADGSLRQDWELYDPNEATFKGATSAWMMALLLDPLFQYWTLTGDGRVGQMIVKWCDFLDRQGMVADGSKAYYVINCFAAINPNEPAGTHEDMEMHNTEMAYTFAMGAYFSEDPARRRLYRKRFDTLLRLAVLVDVNHPARAFGWAFQASSQLVYFMLHRQR